MVAPRTDFILGLADLTGEVMRQAINSVGPGHISVCFDLLNFLHEIHGGFIMEGSKDYSLLVHSSLLQNEILGTQIEDFKEASEERRILSPVPASRNILAVG